MKIPTSARWRWFFHRLSLRLMLDFDPSVNKSWCNFRGCYVHSTTVYILHNCLNRTNPHWWKRKHSPVGHTPSHANGSAGRPIQLLSRDNYIQPLETTYVNVMSKRPNVHHSECTDHSRRIFFFYLLNMCYLFRSVVLSQKNRMCAI